MERNGREILREKKKREEKNWKKRGEEERQREERGTNVASHWPMQRWHQWQLLAAVATKRWDRGKRRKY